VLAELYFALKIDYAATYWYQETPTGTQRLYRPSQFDASWLTIACLLKIGNAQDYTNFKKN